MSCLVLSCLVWSGRVWSGLVTFDGCLGEILVGEFEQHQRHQLFLTATFRHRGGGVSAGVVEGHMFVPSEGRKGGE